MLFRTITVWVAAFEVAMAASLPVRVASFNVRYAATSLGTNEKPWTSSACAASPLVCRKPHAIKHLSQIAANAPDKALTVFGMQEVLDSQLTDILKGLGSDWKHIGVGRDNGAKSGEYSPILYRSSVLTVMFSETKWLSPTPDVVSFGWGAGSRRVVTIGVFKHTATGKQFIHANTHLDNASAQARSEGIKVVVARIKAVQAKYGPLAVMLTGDFNSDPSGEAYKALVEMKYLEDMWSVATHSGKNQGTFSGFAAAAGSRIDYVWLGATNATRPYTAQKVEIMDNVSDGIIFSDHRSVVGDITLL